MLLHTEAFTHRSFDAQMLLHTHTGLVFVQATVSDYAEGSYKMSLCTKWLWPAGLPQAIKYRKQSAQHLATNFVWLLNINSRFFRLNCLVECSCRYLDKGYKTN